MITVVRYQSPAAAPWNACVASARNGLFLFNRGYMDYHRDRFDDHSLMFHNDGPPVAVFPANREGDTLCSHRGLTFGGLLPAADCRLHQVHTLFKRLVDHMHSEGMHRLVYRAIPHVYQRVPGEADLHALEQLGATVSDTRVSCVLKVGSGPGMRPSRRRAISRARKEGITVERADGLASFMRILVDCLAERHGAAPVHTLDEISLLHSRFPSHIETWVSVRDGSILAGLVLFRDHSCARVQYAATTREGRETSALDLVYDHLVRNILPDGSWLDLGPSMNPDDGCLNASLLFYKESLGGQTLLYRTYVLELD